MKKSSKKAKPEHAGIMRNDLAGYMKLRGSKIYVRKGRGLHGFRRAFSNRLCSVSLTYKKQCDTSIDITMKHYKEFRPDKLIKKMSEVL